MTNSSSILMDEAGQAEPLTLSEKLRARYKEGGPGSRAARFARALFVFQAVTQLYVTLRYLVPFVFQGFDPWAQYFLKVFACYICVMGLANWLCILLYR